jgi:2-dehydropantoate 2-reductase
MDMKQIQNVAIIGAGALGLLFGSKLFSAPDVKTYFIAEGSRADRLEKEPLAYNGVTCPIPVLRPIEGAPTMDMVIVAVKHNQLEEAVAGLRPVVREDTIFISLLNGLESEETIAHFYGKEHVLYAIAVGMDTIRDGQEVYGKAEGKIVFGNEMNTVLSEDVKHVKALFEKAIIPHDVPENMLRAMWWKFMINVSINQASAILRANYGVFQTNPDVRAVMDALVDEVIAISAPAGINLNQEDKKQWHKLLLTLGAQGKTSMLQDVEQGRQTEVELFAGKVVKLGEKYGIPTPMNAAVLKIIRALDAMANA